MANLPAFRESLLSTIGLGKTAPEIEMLRGACVALLAGVPASDREAMLQWLETMRRNGRRCSTSA